MCFEFTGVGDEGSYNTVEECFAACRQFAVDRGLGTTPDSSVACQARPARFNPKPIACMCALPSAPLLFAIMHSHLVMRSVLASRFVHIKCPEVASNLRVPVMVQRLHDHAAWYVQRHDCRPIRSHCSNHSCLPQREAKWSQHRRDCLWLQGDSQSLSVLRA